MKKLFGLVAILVLITCTVACGKTSLEGKLVIRGTSWSGWNGGNSYKIDNEEFAILKGKEYTYNNDFKFEIIKINDDSVVIKTKDAYSDSENGIDLHTTKTKFTITYEKELKLATPTMDVGTSYYLILEK